MFKACFLNLTQRFNYLLWKSTIFILNMAFDVAYYLFFFIKKNHLFLIYENVKEQPFTLRRRRKRKWEQFSMKKSIDNRDLNVRN